MRSLVVVLVALVALPFGAHAADSQTAPTLTVTPDSDLASGDVVDVEASGLHGQFANIVCYGDISTGSTTTGCGQDFQLFSESSNSTTFTITRFVTVGDDVVDCAAPNATCGFLAAELELRFPQVIIEHAVVTAPVSLRVITDVFLPDLIVKNRATGELYGDDIYVSGQRRWHTVAIGGKWSYAVRVQNDGDTVDDITVFADRVGALATVRYFVGYYDVTAAVTSDTGFTLRDVAPGEMRRMPVQVSGVGLTQGDLVGVNLRATSNGEPELLDAMRLQVFAVNSP